MPVRPIISPAGLPSLAPITSSGEARTLERLLESEAQLREAQRIARLGSFRWEAAANRTTFSDELLRILEIAPDAFDGRWQAFMNRVHPEDAEQVFAATRTALAAGGALELEHRLLLPSGAERTVHVRAQATLGPDGTAATFAGTAQDVTEQRAAEAAARGREEAERASHAKSEFLSRMSHELRTPLNAILGFGQLLELDPLTSDQRDSVGHILKAGAHLLALIDEVLEIARIEAGALRVTLEPVPLAAAVREIVDLVSPLAAERNVAIAVDAGTAPHVHVLADAQRLKQILLNLVANAIKYNRDGGLVTVRLRSAPAGRARVAISDTGEGLLPEELERIFSPFERLGASDGGQQGTGLGLAVSRQLAEAMGGELSASSVPGLGCDFSLLLDPAPAPAAALTAPAAGAATTAASPPRRRRVLCVEDNPSNLRLVERVLARAGVEVLAAPEGRLGIDLARRQAPDLVLLDLDLPDLPGEAVLATLAADPATAGIPVVVCSADATRATIDRVTARGARAYLTKPLDVDQLLKTVLAPADEIAVMELRA